MDAKYKIAKLTSILLLGAICIGYGAYAYQNRVSDLNLQVKDLFEKVLEEKLVASNAESITLVGAFRFSQITEMPSSVYLTTKKGRVEYEIPLEKQLKNITEDSRMRAFHSSFWAKKPIPSDTLNLFWQRKLRASHLTGKVALSINYTDLDKQVQSDVSSNRAAFSSDNELFTCYLGYRCEVELIGYINYSLLDIWKSDEGIYLLLLLICCVAIYLFITYLLKRFYRLSESKSKEIVIIKYVKEVVAIKDIRIYQLKENFIFDAEQKILITDNKQIKLQKQSCILLELLLNADKNELTDDVLIAHFWKDGSGNSDRVYSMISRLRIALQSAPSIQINRTLSNTYKLIIF